MVINPDQFKMLMTGNELINYITHPRHIRDGETNDQYWTRKLEEAKAQPIAYDVIDDLGKPQYTDPHGSGVYDSIKTSGYTHVGPPVQLRHTPDGAIQQRDAAHRIAVAAALENEGFDTIYFPVEHSSVERLIPGRSNWSAPSEVN